MVKKKNPSTVPAGIMLFAERGGGERLTEIRLAFDSEPFRREQAEDCEIGCARPVDEVGQEQGHEGAKERDGCPPQHDSLWSVLFLFLPL